MKNDLTSLPGDPLGHHSSPPADPLGHRSSPPATSAPGWLRLWWRADRLSLLRGIALTVALISYALLWPRLLEHGPARLIIINIALHLFVTAWLMLVSLGVRSVGSRDVLGAFLLGTFLVPMLVFLPLKPVISRIGPDSDALAVWWVPPMEEFAILAAVSLIAWRLYRQRHRRPGVIDLAVIGWSVGSGYSIHEDALYGRLIADLDSGSFTGAFQGFYGWIFPTFIENNPPYAANVMTYHAGSGLLFGVVLGAALLLRSRVKHIMWLVPVVWLYLTIDHSLGNHLVSNFDMTPWRHLTGAGHVLAVLCIAVALIALLADYSRRKNVTMPLSTMGLGGIVVAARGGPSPLRKLVRVLAAARYHRTRNGAINAIWRDRLRDPDLMALERWALLAYSWPGAQAHEPGVELPHSGSTAPSAAAWPSPPPAPPVTPPPITPAQPSQSAPPATPPPSAWSAPPPVQYPPPESPHGP